MASHRDPNAKIILAANSPLYAPVLLAQAERMNRTCTQMRLEVAKYPSSLAAPHKIDPFIDRLLSQADVDEEILIGIGDPMRMTAIPLHTARYAEPKVVGNLINKMCYWLVDHRDYNSPDGKWEEAFEKVLVHPKGMAGFTVPCFDYLVRNDVSVLAPPHDTLPDTPSPEKGDVYDRLNELLIDELDPNHEREFYDGINRQLEKRNSKLPKPLAFITTNPLHVSRASTFAKQYVLVRKFYDNTHLQNVIMTGIIVAQEINEEEKDAISAFKEGVVTAIEFILSDPAHAAYSLFRGYENGQLRIWNSDHSSVKPYFATWTLKELKQSLVTLGKISAYNPTLEIKRDHWERTKQMRSVVEPLLEESEKSRKALTLPDEYCEFHELSAQRFSGQEEPSGTYGSGV